MRLNCVDCGKPREVGRRQCRLCYLAAARARSKERFRCKGRYNYTNVCEVCGQFYVVARKSSRYCFSCRRAVVKGDGKIGGACYAYLKCEAGSPVWEHTWIAETVLGRTLKKHEVVYHLDGNMRNNVKRNLVVLSRSKHAVLHAFLRDLSIAAGGKLLAKQLVSTSLSWLCTANVKHKRLD